MERYKVLSQLGDGSYGSVWKAINRETGEMVAIKRMKRKFFSWEECMSLREVRSLRKLEHPSIVKLLKVVRENNELFFVFEHLDQNLYQAMKQRQGRAFSEVQVRDWVYQILQGLRYLHGNGYFHRDMKPENLLVRGSLIKIADFGLARELSSQPPYTEYVSTRWYRAPEVLLRKMDYSAPVDMFAVGAIMAELFTLKPLFPGLTEIDELCKISAVMGSFTAETWPEGNRLCQAMGFRLEPASGQPLQQVVPQAPPEALDLIAALCQWDPARRPTAAQALQHPFFKDCAQNPHPGISAALQEKTNTATSGAQAVAAPLMPDPQPAAASGSGRLLQASALPLAHPAPGAGEVDWMPMHSRMQMAAASVSTITIQQSNEVPVRGKQRKPLAGQPPDLWVNAKGLMQSRQQSGFAQVHRGAAGRQGAWASQRLSVAEKPHFPSRSGPNGDPPLRTTLPAHRKANAPVAARSKKALKAAQEVCQPVFMVEGKKRADSAQSSTYLMPDAKLGDFGPLSASLRRAAAASAAQHLSGLSSCFDK